MEIVDDLTMNDDKYLQLIERSKMQTNKRVQVFKNGLSKICGRQPLKNLKGYGLLKGCLPQILLSPFLNTFSPVLHDNTCPLLFFITLLTHSAQCCYNVETSPLIYTVNCFTGFYI